MKRGLYRRLASFYRVRFWESIRHRLRMRTARVLEKGRRNRVVKSVTTFSNAEPPTWLCWRGKVAVRK